ncbi:hypothetical protein OK016_05815 [Vibrio chagasii]|nr:hypothetical protein [Vibrio chagasii]
MAANAEYLETLAAWLFQQRGDGNNIHGLAPAALINIRRYAAQYLITALAT